MEPPASFTIAKRLARYGFAVRFFQLTVDWENADGLSVVLAVIQPIARPSFLRVVLPNVFGGRICGFGCSFSCWRALWKAYREAALNAWMVFLKPEIYSEAYDMAIGNNRAHFLYYLNPQHTAAFEFLESCQVPRIQLVREDLGAADAKQGDTMKMLAFLKRNRMNMQWSILARPEDSASFFVVRASAAKVQDLWFGPSWSVMNTARVGSAETIQSNQPWPHPIA